MHWYLGRTVVDDGTKPYRDGMRCPVPGRSTSSPRTSKVSSQRSIGEIAWAVCRLLELTEALRVRGWCAGPLCATDVSWVGRTIRRSRAQEVVHKIRRYWTAKHHLAHGHDHYCVTLGLPKLALQRVVDTWAGEDKGLFLLDCIDEAATSLQHHESWPGMSRHAVLKHVVGRRVTLHSPTDERKR